MRCRLAVLGAANVQGGCAIKFDLRPFQIANLDGTQAVAVRSEAPMWFMSNAYKDSDPV